MGPALGGRGFVVSEREALSLGVTSSTAWARRLTTGRDITGRHRNRVVIDVRAYKNEDELQRGSGSCLRFTNTFV